MLWDVPVIMPATNPGVVVATLVAPAARDATPEMVGVCPTTASVARNDDVDPTKVTVNVPVVLGLTALVSPIVEAIAVWPLWGRRVHYLSLIHISEPTRPY